MSREPTEAEMQRAGESIARAMESVAAAVETVRDAPVSLSLTAAADSLEAAAEMGELAESLSPLPTDDLLREALRETAAKDRAVAALLREIDEEQFCECGCCLLLTAALAVARAVGGTQ